MVRRIPLLHTAAVRKYSEGPDRDPRGNLIKRWADPVSQPVYGWAVPRSTEPKVSGHDRVVVEVELFAPEEFDCGPQDKVLLSGVEYSVIGRPEDYNHGPFGWRPGIVVNLKKAEG